MQYFTIHMYRQWGNGLVIREDYQFMAYWFKNSNMPRG